MKRSAFCLAWLLPLVVQPHHIATAQASSAAAAESNSVAAAESNSVVATQPNSAVETPAAGRFSAARLYNLGNAYARAGQPGLAILSYERAALLAPDDADIRFNAAAVRVAAGVPVETRSKFVAAMALGSDTFICGLGFAGFILAGASSLVRRRALRLIGGLGGVAMLALPVSNAMLLWPKLRQGVVVVDSAPLRASPALMGSVLLSAREGELVSISGEREDFMLVRTTVGRTGWMPKADLARIVPRAYR